MDVCLLLPKGLCVPTEDEGSPMGEALVFTLQGFSWRQRNHTSPYSCTRACTHTCTRCPGETSCLCADDHSSGDSGVSHSQFLPEETGWGSQTASPGNTWGCLRERSQGRKGDLVKGWSPGRASGLSSVVEVGRQVKITPGEFCWAKDPGGSLF